MTTTCQAQAAPHGLPHAVEVLLAGTALVLLSPVLAALALAVRLTSRGPVLYRQQRLGRDGVPFTLLKLRTMTVGADAAGLLTVGRDARVTGVGGFLRRHKLDELPQLVNVLRGDMGLVGARPEVPSLVRVDLPDQRLVLAHRPGLTDPASLAFADEARLLAGAPDPAALYRREVLPEKLRMSAEYLRTRSARSDVVVLVRTAGAVLRPGPDQADRDATPAAT